MSTELDKYVSELLFDYDCVIVPQLGGFVTNYKPAYFDKGIAHPPSKELRFNKNLTKNDGLLSQSISSSEGLSIQEADAILHETVEKYLGTLKERGRIELNKVGILFIDENKQLRFKADTKVNYLRQSFGFESFAMPAEVVAKIPVVEQKVVEKTVEEETPVIPMGEPSSYNKGIYWVAAATLLPFIGMSIYLGMTTDFKSPTQITPAELIPLGNSASPKYAAREITLSEEELNDETNYPENTLIFPFDFETNKVDSLGVWINMSDVSEEDVVEKTLVNQGIYHIIGGCFGEKQNADQFVNRLQARGYNASVLDLHKGLYRVKIESFANYDEALNELRSTRGDGSFPNAWLLKKKMAENG
ncbi:MAG TPA: SPOR domain-containing protein [Cryomorphaceae bacterium]|nr:SPOR domain-containing protein [Cryomorphaceae bacterium]